MELMSLLAKLTLDKSEYDKGLEEAEKDAKDLTLPEIKIPRTDNKEFDEGVKEAEETGGVFKEVMVGVWNGIKDGIAATSIVATVSNIVGWMKQGISLAIDNGKAIADGSKNLQISQKAYQELDYVLEKSNLQMKDLTKTMTTIDKIRGGDITDDQAKYFEELGISAEDAKSGVMSAEEILTSLMESLAGYEGADKGAIIDAFFGNKKEWTGFFSQTAEEIENLKQTANSMGLIMSDKSVENAVKFKEATERIQDTFNGIQQSFGESIIPSITQAVEGVERVIKFLTADRRTLTQILADQDKAYAKDVAEIEGEAKAAETLIDKLVSMGDTAKMTNEQFAIWQGTAQALIDLFPEMAGYIDVETGTINGNTASLKENIKQWELLAKQKALQGLYEEKYAAVAEKLGAITEEQINLNKKEAEASAKKEAAMKAANEYLHDAEEGEYRQQISGMTDVTDENWAKALLFFTSMDGEAGDAMRAYNNVANEIYGIKDNIEALTKDYEEGLQEYNAWSQAADQTITTLNSDAADATSQAGALKEVIDSIPDEKHINISVDEEDYTPHAIGSAYIPYDNYHALLHRGEKVLTATQARKDSGSSVDLSGLGDTITAAIRNGMENVSVNSYLGTKNVTDTVNRESVKSVKARRYRG